MKFEIKCKSCSSKKFKKIGSFLRKSDRKSIQRYQCLNCKKSFSNSTFTQTYYFKRRNDLKLVEKHLVSGSAIRDICRLEKMHYRTVVRRMKVLNLKAVQSLEQNISKHKRQVQNIQFDDLITSIHTKLKPAAVSVAVEKSTGMFLGARVSQIPAFGIIAKKSVQKYGYRESHLKEGINELFSNISKAIAPESIFETDQHQDYPELIQNHFPDSVHQTYQSIKGSIVGQGELKKTNKDPIFMINQRLATLRAKINRLFRRTWNTTKIMERLQWHINIFMSYFNRERCAKLDLKHSSG